MTALPRERYIGCLVGLAAGDALGAPLGLFHAARRGDLVRDSLLTSALTHVHPEAAWSTVAVNLAIAELLAGPREDLIARVAAQVEEEAVRATLLAAPGLARRDVRS